MIKFSVESFTACEPEIKKLIDGHYQELALNKDKAPLDPRWEIYEEAEKLGKLLFISLREPEQSTLIGYFIGFVELELHYKSTLGCTMDILYVHPTYRGLGAGNNMMKFLEKTLKEMNVQRVFLGTKMHKDIGLLFERHKYKPVEVYYSKWIGD